MGNEKFLRKNNIQYFMTNGKIHIKVGSLEVDYEGTEEYIKNDLLTTVEKVKEMFGIEELPRVPAQSSMIVPPTSVTSGGFPKGTVKTIAAKMKANTGPDLALAAAAQMTLVEGRDSFSRKQILETMKKAAGYYKDSFGSNLGQTLINLVKKQRLHEVSKDTYSLPQEVREELEVQLA